MREKKVVTNSDNNSGDRDMPPSEERGPLLGETAPGIEAVSGESRIGLSDFRGKWIILLSHPAEFMPLFWTRTIKHLLCKRRIRVIGFGDDSDAVAAEGKGLLKRYIRRHSITIIRDTEGVAAGRYGLEMPGAAPDQKKGKGVFIIDPKGVLRVKLYHPIEAEVDFYDILKLVDALQIADGGKTVRKKIPAWRSCLNIIIRPASTERG